MRAPAARQPFDIHGSAVPQQHNWIVPIYLNNFVTFAQLYTQTSSERNERRQHAQMMKKRVRPRSRDWWLPVGFIEKRNQCVQPFISIILVFDMINESKLRTILAELTQY